MYTRIAKSGGHEYLQLVESYRNENGQPRVRVIASLGRVDKLRQNPKKLEPLIKGLERAAGRPGMFSFEPDSSPKSEPEFEFETALEHGHVYALDCLWRELGLREALLAVLREIGVETEVEAWARVIVFNRLCDTRKKMLLPDWLEKVSMPNFPENFTELNLRETMDALTRHAERFEEEIAVRLRMLIDHEPTTGFCDIVSLTFNGQEMTDAKQGGVSRYAVGLTRTTEGQPLAYAIHPGYASNAQTLQSIASRVFDRFPSMRNLVILASRKIPIADNLGMMADLANQGNGRRLEYVLGLPSGRESDLEKTLPELDFHERIGEFELATKEFEGHRYFVTRDPAMAKRRTESRRRRISEITGLAERLEKGLRRHVESNVEGLELLLDASPDNAQDAQDDFEFEVGKAKLGRFIKCGCSESVFEWSVDENAVRRAEILDGIRAIVTNASELDAAESFERYRESSEATREFRFLEDDNRKDPERFPAYAFIRFLVLVLRRTIRSRLKANGLAMTPETALRILSHIHQNKMKIDGRDHEGITRRTAEQAEILQALGVPEPD